MILRRAPNITVDYADAILVRRSNHRLLVRYISAASIFVCILSTQKMEKVFDNVFTSFIGRYSFELYNVTR